MPERDGERPHILIIETSGRQGSVGIGDGKRLALRTLDQQRRHAGDLAPVIEALLEERGLAPKDINALFVSRGPGSYTGLRVGIMTAKTWAYATGCRLIAVDTLAAVALQMPEEDKTVDVIADAQQRKIYVQQFHRHKSDNPAVSTTPLAVMDLSDWLRSRDRDIKVSGPGLHTHREEVACAAILADSATWDPQLDAVLQAGLYRYYTGEQDDLWGLEPLYLRPSSAEEKWSSRQTVAGILRAPSA